MKALIILAHGSRRKESNLEVATLTEKVERLSTDKYKLVACAFLELAEPSLMQAIDSAVDQGMSRITVLPYFLNSGNHVTQDIPEIIEAARKKHPGCDFTVTRCIGMDTNMPELILKHSETREQASLRVNS